MAKEQAVGVSSLRGNHGRRSPNFPAEVKEAKAATTELQATCNVHKGHVVVLKFKPVLQAAVVC